MMEGIPTTIEYVLTMKKPILKFVMIKRRTTTILYLFMENKP